MRDLTPQSVRTDTFVDIQLDPNGDLKLLPNGDIALDDDVDALEQAIRWRLMTQIGNWALEPQCGTDLEGFAGRPNNEQTAEDLRAEIYRALGHDEFLMADEIDVQVAPISSSRMAVILMLRTGLTVETAAFQFELDLITGELSGWQRIA